MTAPYILARNFGDAHRFAQDRLGLARGHYRVVTSPSTIKAVRGAEVHLVPGWEGRFDRFAMRTALRYTRLTVVNHEPVEAPAPVVVDTPTPLSDPPADGQQTEASPLVATVDEVADDLEPSGVQLAISVEEQPDAEEKPAADKRRRRRCKNCGNLVHPDEVDSHSCEV